MRAIDAKQLVISKPERDFGKKLEYVFHRIRENAEEGKSSLHLNDSNDLQLKKRLEDLGYKVEFKANSTFISWE